MLDGLSVFLQNLPKLLSIASKIFQILSDRNSLEWINTLEASVDSLQKAKDAYEKGMAAQAVAQSIRDLQ